MAAESLEARVEVVVPEEAQAIGANFFQLSRLGADIQIDISYISINDIARAAEEKIENPVFRARMLSRLLVPLTGFIKLHDEVLRLRHALVKSGHLVESPSGELIMTGPAKSE